MSLSVTQKANLEMEPCRFFDFKSQKQFLPHPHPSRGRGNRYRACYLVLFGANIIDSLVPKE
jgi:hypothetical protein